MGRRPGGHIHTPPPHNPRADHFVRGAAALRPPRPGGRTPRRGGSHWSDSSLQAQPRTWGESILESPPWGGVGAFDSVGASMASTFGLRSAAQNLARQMRTRCVSVFRKLAGPGPPGVGPARQLAQGAHLRPRREMACRACCGNPGLTRGRVRCISGGFLCGTAVHSRHRVALCRVPTTPTSRCSPTPGSRLM